MPRFFIAPERIRDGRFTLSGDEARHARTVLRKRPGDEIELFDGRDSSYVGLIEKVEPLLIQGTIQERSAQPPIGFDLTLVQSVLKGPKWDWLLEKACEIGVRSIVPLLTERTVIRPKDAPAKLERWNRIALAASKQCGRPDVMRIHTPIAFSTYVTHAVAGSLFLIPWEKETRTTIAQACAGSASQAARVLIGPEGGWTMGEIELAKRHGAVTVRLGPTLLRAETAGVVASVLILKEFGLY